MVIGEQHRQGAEAARSGRGAPGEAQREMGVLVGAVRAEGDAEMPPAGPGADRQQHAGFEL
ncbi:MAG: hypothetical protein JJU15_19420 [Pararhodobacter sp.]|nr:hypothetical protein [Pararhodobacter sp.]